jgi:hypothetical protein
MSTDFLISEKVTETNRALPPHFLELQGSRMTRTHRASSGEKKVLFFCNIAISTADVTLKEIVI